MGYMRSYQGDYLSGYAGDPGFFGGLFRGIKKIGGALIRRTPVGAAVGVLGGAAVGRRAVTRRPFPPGPPGLARFQQAGQVPTPGRVAAIQRLVPGGQTGMMDCPKGFHPLKSGPEAGTRCVRNRSMNIANPRALRRAVRRQEGFIKLAKRSLPPGYRITTRTTRRAKAKPC